ncbi:matrix metalloproteinase-24-like [Anabrus simplex]|uniref:matrix metalloproteinase-24-like n=1 Tax=Anabrus simplex TaxID=316456 RepID=UPI0035A2FFF5
MLFLVLGSTAIHAAPVNSKTLSSTEALKYLSQYGYIQGSTMDMSAGLIRADAVSSAVKQFQLFAGLTPTGQLDEATVQKMNTPRCGVKDVIPQGNSTRSKRYVLAGTRWRKQHLTYTLMNYPSYMQPSIVQSEIARAFKVWSDHVDLTFSPVPYGYKADIVIMFASGEHGDGNPFDGRGGTLAHAYFPEQGDVHFDNAEFWTVKSNIGTNFFQTAAHEIGHALGLNHSENPAALMAPFYQGYQPYFRLHKDDIAAIQHVYARYTRFQYTQNRGQKNQWYNSNRRGFSIGAVH